MKGGCHSRLESCLNSGVRGPQSRVARLPHVDGHQTELLIVDAHQREAFLHSGGRLTRTALEVGTHEDVGILPGDGLDDP